MKKIKPELHLGKHHVAKISLLRANEPVITVMIRFPCASQIRCVNIIKKRKIIIKNTKNIQYKQNYY